MMTTQEAIATAVRRLVAAANPQKIILFGSYAGGRVTADSDLDLLVIEREVVAKRQEMVRLRKAIGSVGSPWMCWCIRRRKFPTGVICPGGPSTGR